MTDSKIPTHIAIQMDGNRRWGRKNKGNSLEGHRQGGETLKQILEHCKKIGVKILTVYALSTENLKRSKEELAFHFGLHKKYLKKHILDSDDFIKNKTKFQVLGRTELLPKDEQELIKQAEEKTKDFDDCIFNVCLCYNGQDEIVDATKRLIQEGVKPEDITREKIKENLYTKDLPPPEMMIKTGMNPEKRISAFLLWDTAYTELFFSSILWPDFSPDELDKLIEEYNQRERRFGK
jgi:undecaprenyl diphosphate synthase|tara:strand:+ start:445 stop:1152 length:708 start_codon:yes stop_codon:yes gene_type:complete